MCVYHGAPYQFSSREERLTWVQFWPNRLEQRAMDLLFLSEALLSVVLIAVTVAVLIAVVP